MREPLNSSTIATVSSRIAGKAVSFSVVGKAAKGFMKKAKAMLAQLPKIIKQAFKAVVKFSKDMATCLNKDKNTGEFVFSGVAAFLAGNKVYSSCIKKCIGPASCYDYYDCSKSCHGKGMVASALGAGVGIIAGKELQKAGAFKLLKETGKDVLEAAKGMQAPLDEWSLGPTFALCDHFKDAFSLHSRKCDALSFFNADSRSVS